MILTGRTTVHQKIYPQTGLSFALECPEMKDFNLTFFGPTGFSGKFEFTSGKIYNPSGYFINTYRTGEPLSFDINFSTGLYSSWFNNDLTEASRRLSTGNTTYITGFTFTGKYSGTMDMSISLNGNRPGLYFSPLITQNLRDFSGFVRVTGFASELYRIDPFSATGQVNTAGSFTSGNYYISGTSGLFSSGSLVETDFYFDFGKHTENLAVAYDNGISASGYINLSASEAVTGLFTVPSTGYRQYTDTNITSVWGDSTEFLAYLEFLYRSGYTTVYGTGIGTGLYSGYLSGSGYLTGRAISGYVNTGYYYKYTGQVPTGISPAVMMTGTGVLYAYSTGMITYYYDVLATGYERHYPDDFDINTTGRISGWLTGYIAPGSGKYHFYGNVSGHPSTWSGFTDGGIRTGFLTGYYPGNPSSFYTSNYSGDMNYLYLIDYTGILATTMYNYPGTGAFTGANTGTLIYSTAPGYITGFNLLTGSYGALTGSYNTVYNSFYNYYAENGYDLINGYLIKGDADQITGGAYSVGARILYDRNIEWGVKDYIRLWGQNQYMSTGIDLEGYPIGN